MQGRVPTAIAAWMLGATAATGVSLLAVSLLDRAMAPERGPVLSSDDVGHAQSGPTTTPGTSGVTPSATNPSPGTRNQVETTPMPTPTPTSIDVDVDGDHVLAVAGGSVVAQCRGKDVYLVSWSPAQGYQVGGYQRGPASTAGVAFTGSGKPDYLRVKCAEGFPVLTDHHDDGGDGDTDGDGSGANGGWDKTGGDS